MKKILIALLAILAAGVPPVRGQAQISSTAKPSFPESKRRTFFPKNWVRGFVDFGIAPSHNEPDLGRCAFPQAPNSGGAGTRCTAYARYMLSGYMEFQPLARTPARHFFLFFEPKISFGHNVPQLNYSASMEPIAYDRSVGIGFQLPRNFEVRATQHQVDAATMVLDRQVVADRGAPAVDRQRPIVDGVGYEQRDDLLRALPWAVGV